jgi:hypothetical protein
MHRNQHGWSRWSALPGLGLLVLQMTAAAQPRAPVPALLQVARRHFDNLEYEQALVELLSAQRLTRTQDELVSLLLLKGIILAELGNKAESSSAFREALSLRPGAVLPPDVSPKIRRQFEAVSAALAVAKPEPEEQPTKPGPRAEPRPARAAQPPNAPAMAEASAPPASTVQPPAALPQVNVVVSPNQEINFAPLLTPFPATAPSGAVDVNRSQALDPHILIPVGAGGALAIAGGVFWALAKKEFNKIESGDPRLNSLSAVQGSASSGRTYQTVGFSLMGAGLVGMGLAAGLYGMDGARSPVDLSVGTNGSQMVLRGRWR